MCSHDEGHVERVLKLALFIAEKEGADREIVRKAAELHDITRDKPDHAVEGARVAREKLKKEGYSEEFIEKVAHCIKSHSFSVGVKAKTLEAKILSDADKLDAMGAIGAARAFIYSGEKGRSIEDTLRHFEEKLLNLKNLIETETGRKIADERHAFLLEFYKKLKEEIAAK
jgi:uncharacterized protein